MGPTSSVLVNGLSATRKKFSPIAVAQTESSSCGFVCVSARAPSGMCNEVAQYRLDETVVRSELASVAVYPVWFMQLDSRQVGPSGNSSGWVGANGATGSS